MTPRDLTGFEQILLGLLAAEPRSGYELKRFFATTPAGVYEPSSGALYPALRRLEHWGLLASEQITSAGGRSRRRYRLTPRGHVAHGRWLRRPVRPSTISRDLGMHLMRFVMAEGVLSPAEILSFLTSLATALGALVADTESYLAVTPTPGRHPALALRHGLEVQRASLRWVRSTIETLDPTRAPATGTLASLGAAGTATSEHGVGAR